MLPQPRLTVGDIIREPLEVHNILHGKEREARVRELMEVVGLNPYFVNRYIKTATRASYVFYLGHQVTQIAQ